MYEQRGEFLILNWVAQKRVRFFKIYFFLYLKRRRAPFQLYNSPTIKKFYMVHYPKITLETLASSKFKSDERMSPFLNAPEFYPWKLFFRPTDTTKRSIWIGYWNTMFTVQVCGPVLDWMICHFSKWLRPVFWMLWFSFILSFRTSSHILIFLVALFGYVCFFVPVLHVFPYAPLTIDLI